MPRTRNALLAAVPLVTVLIAGSLMATGADAQSASEGSADMVSARVQSFDITTTATGELEARQQVEVRNPLEKGATITEIVPEGTRVSAGDVLVRFSVDAIENDLDTAELALEEAKIEFANAESAFRIQESDNQSKLRTAELELELAELAHQQWLAGDDLKQQMQMKVALDNAGRQLERLAEKYERSTKLVEQGFLSQDEWKLDGIRLAEAEAQAEIAELDLKAYMTYQRPRDEKQRLSDVQTARENLDRVIEQNQINLTNREAEVLSRKRRLEYRQDNLTDLQKQQALATVRAPTDGLVVYATSLRQGRWGQQEGPLQIGRTMQPNELLVVLPDTSEMVAAVRVHESLAGRIRPGQAAEIRVDAAGGQVFRGRVESIGVLAESGDWRDPNRREYTVKLALAEDPGSSLKPSMRCEAKLQLAQVEEVLTVPVQAVFADGSIRYVYTQSGSRFMRTPVRVGRRSATNAEIVAGLEEGEQVLLREPSPGEIIDSEWDMEQVKALAGSGRAGGPPQGVAQRPTN